MKRATVELLVNDFIEILAIVIMIAIYRWISGSMYLFLHNVCITFRTFTLLKPLFPDPVLAYRTASPVIPSEWICALSRISTKAS
jgi:hypothetical protein